ncbi:MAG: FAD-dependent oxidoreductase [Chloroflexota bacterium]|nr:FAD-dependent oxidoreductase [Chloroflexota bacterium]
MNADSLNIRTGSKIAVIGGGPAGSFFALHLLRFADEIGISPEISIYQQRDFDSPGPKGCKGCAGVLSASLLRNMGELGLAIPSEVLQDTIENYALHSPYTSISIHRPEQGVEVASVYRGGGPSVSRYEDPASFDGWLIREAQNRGANVRYQQVKGIYIGHESRIEVEEERLAYDLIVLASGANTKPIPMKGSKYVPPKTQLMAQGELYVGVNDAGSYLGSVAHVFLIPSSKIIFGTLVPKGPSIHVSVLSSGDKPVSIEDFLKQDIVRSMLPGHYEQTCACRPRAVVSPASNYYTDRFVAVGDAAVSRLFKDGIGSSFLTAREAARTTVWYGISHRDFKQHYYPLCRGIERDNQWGKLLFSIHARSKNSRAFLLAQQRLVGDEQNNTTGPQPFTKMIWGMFTGGYTYRSMTRMAFNPGTMTRLSRSFVSAGLKGIFHRGIDAPRTLEVGNKRNIVVLGSGFAGTYTLRNLVRHLNRNENVEITMLSNENFFLFSPLLHEAAMGRIGTWHIAYPIRKLHHKDRFSFVQATVERIDLRGRRIITDSGVFEYDHLVMALGSVPDMSGLPSNQSNVYTLKTLRDSMLIRNHIISVLEQANGQGDLQKRKQLLTFIVSGGGYTGVQLVTELRDFIFRHLLKSYRTLNPQNIRIVLIEAEQQITGGLHPKLANYAMRQLGRMGIDVRLESRVTNVWENRVELNNHEILPTNTLLWVAGVVANPRIAELEIEQDNIGRVVVQEDLEVRGFPGVYAAGDCACVIDPESGQTVPPRAHNAVRQAMVVSHNILAEIRGTNKKTYHYNQSGEVVSLGASQAVFRFHGFRAYGLLARLVWLGGYSLLVMGRYNRVRIVMDWLSSMIFGRDTTYIRLEKD